MTIPSDFKGAAKRLDDIDLPRIAQRIGCGEDVLHALIEVETSGHGFDSHGRPVILFEPHIFDRLLRGEERETARRLGLAYPHWQRKYPKESYTRLLAAIPIDETAALEACSWGLSQILGLNYRLAGFASVQEMVIAFMADEENHLEAMISFVISAGIADDLRRIEAKAKRGELVTAADFIPVARAYNGDKFASNQYHVRLARAFNKWLKIKDTPYASADIRKLSAAESEEYARTSIDTTATETVDTALAATKEQVMAETKPDAPTPTEVVKIEKVEPEESPVMKGIKTHYAAAVTFITTSGAGVVAMFKGLPPSLYYGFFGAAALVGIIYMLQRAWQRNNENDRQLEREKMAHELTVLQMQSAMDQKKLTVEVRQ